MGQFSRIEWTDATFNPWIGCERVAPECDHCYAAARSKRVGEPELWEGERRRTSSRYWAEPLKWAKRLPAELGRRPRVFCASLADVFDNRADPAWLADVFALIRATPELDWLLLTKRITRAAHVLERLEAVPANIWLGVSAGTRQAYERDVPRLLAIPGPAVRFVSMEPLLEPVRVDLTRRETSERVYYDNPLTGFRSNGNGGDFGPRLDWIIAGGESGPGARPMHPDWPAAIRAQCAEHNVPFFFKQWGEWAPHTPAAGGDLGGDVRRGRVMLVHPGGETDVEVLERTGRSTLPGSRWVARIGKKAAGRHLEGRLHDAFPRRRDPAPPSVTVEAPGPIAADGGSSR